MTNVIRNCQLGYRCSQSWEQMEETSKANVRFCCACERSVKYCRTPEELQAAIEENFCVAVEVRPLDSPQSFLYVGEPSPSYRVE